MADPLLVRGPTDGIWRVGRQTSPEVCRPADPMDLADTEAGNRWDAIDGSFSTTYWGTTPVACFAEVLADRRPDPALVETIEQSQDWASFMAPGSVEAAWRHQRVLVRMRPDRRDPPFLDVTAAQSLAWLNDRFGAGLSIFTNQSRPLTMADLNGEDRRVTRYLATALYRARTPGNRPFVSGIRFPSKHGQDLECWAIFGDRVRLQPVYERAIQQNDPALEAVAKMFGLSIH